MSGAPPGGNWGDLHILWVLEFLLFSAQLILFIILLIYLLLFELLYITLVGTLYTEQTSFNIFLIFLPQLPKCRENCHLRGKDRRIVRAGGQPELQSETLWMLGNSSSLKCSLKKKKEWGHIPAACWSFLASQIRLIGEPQALMTDPYLKTQGRLLRDDTQG